MTGEDRVAAYETILYEAERLNAMTNRMVRETTQALREIAREAFEAFIEKRAPRFTQGGTG